MEDLYGRILSEGYGLKLAAYQRQRTGLVCKTDKGVKELKKYSSDIKRLNFESEARDYIYKNGFENVVRFEKTVDRLPYFTIEQTTYVLENYIKGRSLESENFDDLLKAAAAMAEMHNASENFTYPEGFSNSAVLEENISKRRRDLVKAKKWIKRQSRFSDVDLIVLENYDYYFERINLAAGILKKYGYDEAIKKAQTLKTLCHNSFKGENVKIDDDRHVFVSGFSNAAYDCTLLDLSDYIRRIIKNSDAGSGDIIEIINAYEKVRPISENERRLLGGMIAFPNKFLKLINGYYNKRRVYVSDAVRQKLKKCIELKETEDKIFKEVWNNI